MAESPEPQGVHDAVNGDANLMAMQDLLVQVTLGMASLAAHELHQHVLLLVNLHVCEFLHV